MTNRAVIAEQPGPGLRRFVISGEGIISRMFPGGHRGKPGAVAGGGEHQCRGEDYISRPNQNLSPYHHGRRSLEVICPISHEIPTRHSTGTLLPLSPKPGENITE